MVSAGLPAGDWCVEWRPPYRTCATELPPNQDSHHRHQLDQVWAVHHLHHRLLVATFLIGAGGHHPHRPLLVEKCLTHRELPHLLLCALGDHLHLL